MSTKMPTIQNPTLALNVLHAREDYLTQENQNLNKTIGLLNDNPNINAILKLTYKRGMTKFLSRHFKQNTDAVGWFLLLIETVTTRCGQMTPIVTLNDEVVNQIEDEFDHENIWELFKSDNRVSHLDYQIKLIKTSTVTTINFDVVMERLVSIGGRASPYGKKVFRLHATSSNYDFYKKLEEHNDTPVAGTDIGHLCSSEGPQATYADGNDGSYQGLHPHPNEAPEI